MRIDMTASQWHHLVKPALAHTVNDKEFPELGHVGIEVGSHSVYAVATDRYTLGAERYPLPRIDRGSPQQRVHLLAGDVKASLAQFSYTKDDDPELTVTIDTVRIPGEIMGQPASTTSMAVTLTGADGSKTVMRDRRVDWRDPLDGWQRRVAKAIARTQGATPAGIGLNPAYLGRWKDAVRPGEQLVLWTGPHRKEPILATVEDHFAGLWAPQVWGEGDGAAPPDPAGLPWLAELDAGVDLRTAAGLLVNPGTGEVAKDE